MCILAIILVDHKIRKRAAFALLIVVVAFALTTLVVRPRVEHWAAEAWQSAGNENMHSYLVPSKELALSDILERGFRVGESSRMTELPNGEIRYQKRSFDIWHTGQRDLLWEAGVSVIRDHPWWGIGYKNWQEELDRRLGYPFRSPHNAFLEIVGGYGVLGGVLYILLILVFLRNLLLIRRRFASGMINATILWGGLSGASWLAMELPDVSTSLAITLVTVWFWIFLGLHESMHESSHAIRNNKCVGMYAA
jgi:O-antigen ligase